MNADKILPILCRYLKDTDNRLLAKQKMSVCVGRLQNMVWNQDRPRNDTMGAKRFKFVLNQYFHKESFISKVKI